MRSRNPWVNFRKLIDGEGRYVVTIVSNNGDGTSTVQTRDGTQLRVKGDDISANRKAMIEGGRISYEVPNLSSSVVEV